MVDHFYASYPPNRPYRTNNKLDGTDTYYTKCCRNGCYNKWSWTRFRTRPSSGVPLSGFIWDIPSW